MGGPNSQNNGRAGAGCRGPAADLDLAGSIISGGLEAMTSGPLAVNTGTGLNVQGLDLVGGVLTQSGGTVTAGAFNAFIVVQPGSAATDTRTRGTYTAACTGLTLGLSASGLGTSVQQKGR